MANGYSELGTHQELKQKVKPIPENDIWIATTCIVHQRAPGSRDTHFQFQSLKRNRITHWSLQVGYYRILYEIDDEIRIVSMATTGHIKSIYKKK